MSFLLFQACKEQRKKKNVVDGPLLQSRRDFALPPTHESACQRVRAKGGVRIANVQSIRASPLSRFFSPAPFSRRRHRGSAITLMKMKMIGTVVSVITQLVTRPNGISVPFLRGRDCPGTGGVIDTGREGAENLRWIYFFLHFHSSCCFL